jgi:hypothetical protein
VRMLYLTSQSGLGSGTLTYMKGGRDEDDDGVPAAALDAKLAWQSSFCGNNVKVKTTAP